MKKKKRCRLLLGYCPFLACPGSRYNSCIVTQRLGRLAWPGGRVTIQTLYRGSGEAFVSQYGCDTSCDMATVRHDTALRVATCAVACDTARAWPWCWVCRDTTYDTAGLGHGTAGHGLRHDALCATIQPSARHDMTPCARTRRSAWACTRRLGSRCVPSAPNPVLDSVHCF